MKIVCLGDSLTKGYGVKSSQAWPMLLCQDMNIEVINKGVNGDTTGGMLARFHVDVINNRPSHVIIFGGINDLSWKVPISVIHSNIQAMVQLAIHNNILPVLATPIPIAIENAEKYWGIIDDFPIVAEQIIEYRKWLVKFSLAYKIKIIDFYESFKEENLTQPLEQYFPDGLHPIAEGHKLMYNRVKVDLKFRKQN